MKKPVGTDATEALALRAAAEQRLARATARIVRVPREPGEAERLLHELEVHQIELELQNEELRRTRGDLETAFEKYAELFDFAPVGYVTVDDGMIVEANLAAATLFSSDRSRLIGRRLGELIAVESHAAFAQLRERLDKGDGHATVEVTLRAGALGERQVQLQGTALETADGTVQWLIAATDISARVRAEQERDALRTRLLAADKLESVGRLAGGVAHDFNNMLGVILGFTERAIERLDEDEPARAELVHVSAAAERAAALTRKLLAFASKQPVKPQRLDLNATIDDSLSMVRRLLGADVGLEWSPGREIWPIFMDPIQIDQVLAALAVNARKAIVGVGRFTLSTANVVVRDSRAGGPAAGDYVLVKASDSGAGMDEVTLRHLFEPFFTSAEFGSSNGLGLAVVYGIIRQNGGSIEVESKIGRGSTFSIFLPRAEAAAPKPAPWVVTAANAGQRTALVLEDEPSLLEVVVIMAERLGFRVLRAGLPSEALRLAAEHEGQLDVLITDVVMPEMNGRELAGRLLKTHPDLRVLYVSGYSAEMMGPRGDAVTGAHFLAKPFTSSELEAKLSELLGDPAPNTMVT